MKTDDFKTVVIFRKYRDGQILALFPYDIETDEGHVNSYMRIGQHGAASLECVKDTKPAKENEYNGLCHELTSIGYDLKVIHRINYKKYKIKRRLDYLRNELRAECISYGELIELQSLSKYIDPFDTELLEAAGVPEK